MDVIESSSGGNTAFTVCVLRAISMTERILYRLRNNATRRSGEALKRDVTRLQRASDDTEELAVVRSVRRLDRKTSVPNTPMATIDVRRISRRLA